MKEDLNNMQNLNIKTVFFISAMMVLVIITQQLERKFFANG